MPRKASQANPGSHLTRRLRARSRHCTLTRNPRALAGLNQGGRVSRARAHNLDARAAADADLWRVVPNHHLHIGAVHHEDLIRGSVAQDLDVGALADGQHAARLAQHDRRLREQARAVPHEDVEAPVGEGKERAVVPAALDKPHAVALRVDLAARRLGVDQLQEPRRLFGGLARRQRRRAQHPAQPARGHWCRCARARARARLDRRAAQDRAEQVLDVLPHARGLPLAPHPCCPGVQSPRHLRPISAEVARHEHVATNFQFVGEQNSRRQAARRVRRRDKEAALAGAR